MNRSVKKKETRNRLIGEAAREFSKMGYARANINEISVKAGFGKGTIYNYFKSKFHLLLAVVEKTMDELISEITSQTSGIDNPVEKLKKGIHADFEFFDRNKDLTNIIIRECFASEPGRQREFIKASSSVIELVMNFIKEGIERGLYPDDLNPFTATLLLIGMVENILLMQNTLGITLGTPEELADMVIQTFVYGIIKR